VSVANATLGITAAALALGGQNWLLPSWTFTASAAALTLAGKSLTFGDVLPHSQELDTESLDDRFDGCLVVAPFGSHVHQPNLPRQVPLIIDAAASLGAAEGALAHLNPDTIVVFSLHATKVLGIGEGGVLVCATSELATEVRAILNFGFRQSRNSLRMGFNGKLTEVMAAVGLCALDDWDLERSDWLSAREVVRELSHSLNLQVYDPGGEWVSPYWIVQAETADEVLSIQRLLTESRIDSRKWWGSGCHEMPAYRSIQTLGLTVTQSVAARNLGLPFYRGFGARESDAVYDALSSWEGSRRHS
jgi:dTDP-4-amino-4,6-dideoxygalactose transaminase